MKYKFYDVKLHAAVQAQVTEAVSYGEGKQKRFAFKGKTKDGRNLTVFVKESEWAKFKGK